MEFCNLTPAVSLFIKVLFNTISDFFSALQYFLKYVLTTNLSESGINHFLNTLSEILNSVSGPNWINDSEVHDSVDIQWNVIFSENDLAV